MRPDKCRDCGKPGIIKHTSTVFVRCKPKEKYGDEYETDGKVFILCGECHIKFDRERMKQHGKNK